MSHTPFFSIIIPTRNRPELFKDALQSVLLQDFDDFELIVSDNSTDNRTQELINTIFDSTKLTVLRTDGSLSMPKHWEFATQKAKGRYVLILTDRSVFKQHTLRTIYMAINSNKEEVLVCAWRWSLFDDQTGCEYADFPIIEQDAVVNLPSKEIAQNFVNRQEGYPYDLPRMLNSCYRHDLAEKIRNKHGDLFKPISPDFTCAFLLLAESKQVLFLDSALFISQGLSISNGGNSSNNLSVAESYLSTLGLDDYYAHVPIKIPLVENIIFEDFLAIQELADGELSNISINWVEYYFRCYKEICEKSNLKKSEFCLLQSQWQQSLSNFDKTIQNKVKKRLASIWWRNFKIRIKKIAFCAVLIKLIKNLLSLTKKNQPPTVLNAAGYQLDD
jgi:glycosyltransferase involved in cell wall biosynthesis